MRYVPLELDAIHKCFLGLNENSGDAALIIAGVFDFGSGWRKCNGILLFLYSQSRSRVINQCIFFVALRTQLEHISERV